MASSGNRLADFPVGKYQITVYCEACGHNAELNREHLPDEMMIQILRKRLRCTACSKRNTSIRISWRASGGFRYSS